MKNSFTEIKTISFNTLDVNKIKKEEKISELFLKIFSTAPKSNKKIALSDLNKDNLLDDFIMALECLLRQMENTGETCVEPSELYNRLKKIIFKSNLSRDFDSLKNTSTKLENSLNLY